ncbi:MAG: penicillin acylase family protein [Gemmatimonadetes bacterium]|nr:penicillin acylase family protein [Gemmatimonadota bacterium]
MHKTVAILALLVACAAPRAHAQDAERARWAQRAARVTITRDDWGIAHVKGPSDADAVFGMIYAQAEDDFNRIEVNYLNALGRMAEAEGEALLARDLRQRLFIDEATLKGYYGQAPAWLRALMDAWADGLNFYLSTHPAVKPRVLARFEPWMALSFSEGSIGGDIERVDEGRLAALYKVTGPRPASASRGDGPPEEPTGSNGFAIAPSRSASKHAMLWINPHTSFFFRSELQVTSDEGLNAYGASTWGQFFIYQGFNEKTGWMHTSSGVDAIDEYVETVTAKGSGWTYAYGGQQRAVTAKPVTLRYKAADGSLATRTVTTWHTHHGPVVREDGGKWIAIRMMNEPLKALQQSFLRTKARSLKEFRQTLEFHTNSSNNTVFADADGDIAYFHANFIPKRDTSFNWRRPVDGSNPATEWKGVHAVDESPNVINPSTGWIQNVNNWPFSAAGDASPKKRAFPSYMEMGTESPRGLHAIKVLSAGKAFTPQGVIDAAFDSELPAFWQLLPPLLKAYDALPASDKRKAELAEPIEVLRKWDMRFGANSIATSVAIFWGEDVWRRARADAESEDLAVSDFLTTGPKRGSQIPAAAPAEMAIASLQAAVQQLTRDFGTWKTPWGDINRFQRLTDDIVHPFDDKAPSLPVAFTSSRWGSLAAFGSRPWPGTKKWYGTSGNSFVAIVEFGPKVRARAITAGGESGDRTSKHFNDQAQRYTTGGLREVYFYPDQLVGHAERSYHPGS